MPETAIAIPHLPLSSVYKIEHADAKPDTMKDLVCIFLVELCF
jgi:hypothetical protein